MEESIKIEEAIAKALKLEAVDPRTYSPLVLAYIGDAVYELLIRTKVINHGSMQVNKMHKRVPAWSRQRPRPTSSRPFRMI